MMMRKTRHILTASLMVLSLLAPAVVSAQVKSVDRLKFPALPEFKIPVPTRVVLGNGMVVILLEDHELPLIDASVRINTGSRLEPADKVGLASLTGSVLRTGGTTTMSGDALDDFLEGRAASIETGIGTEFGSAGMSCLKDDFPKVLKVFANVLRHPVFDPDKIEVARNQMVSGISRQNDNPQQILFREFGKMVYGKDSPYAASPTYASVGSITREDLIAWHKKYFHPNRIILGLAGDFDSSHVLSQIKQVFGDWEKGSEPAKLNVAFNKQNHPGVFYVEKNDMTQSNIAIGHLGIRKDNPDYYPVEVMNEVFSGGFASRLFTNVRSKKGLAYAVRGSVGSDWDHPGTFQMWMTTKTETTAAGIDALLEEARNLTAQPPTDEEVGKAKAAILSSFVFNSDSRRKILNQQITYEYYGYPLDWLSRYRKGIDQVTTSQVRQVAGKFIHPEQFAILVVGPKKGLDRPLSDFGQVAAVDISIPEPAVKKIAASGQAKTAGAALVARVVKGMGGASRIDSVESISSKSKAVATTPQGELEIKSALILEFPDRFRQDLTLPFGTLSTVLTDEDAFVTSPQGARDMPASQKENSLNSMRRMPLVMFKNRSQDSFTALAAGQCQLEGLSRDLLQVELEGEVTTLAIDPASGHIVQMTYQGQDFTGAHGEVVQSFSDFREVDGLSFAFKTQQTFNGKPFVETTVQELKLNQPVASDAFARPEAVTAQKGGK